MWKIRELTFGPADALDRPIPTWMKGKRLAEQGLMELYGVIDTFFDGSFHGPQSRYVEEQSDALIKQFSSAFDKQLEPVGTEVVSLLESTNLRIAADDRIIEAVECLDA